jgi:multiple sugar transport system ATP-binding protein
MSATPNGELHAIECRELTKVYKDGTQALHALDLEVEDGEFLALVGPSGCGKTTLLRMIAGLEHISGGQLTISGRRVNDMPPQARDIAMVFQNYALYPHMTVFDNMAFGLRIRRFPKAEITRRVESAAGLLGLAQSLRKKPAQLSGGQRQRVAMGRAIVREPRIYLMDEPLSNLDAQLRVEMRAEIARLQRRLGVTTIYVTHDQTEAMVLGDRVAVLRDGVLQQHATPQELYTHPANSFVGQFIGSPSMNLYPGTARATEDGVVVRMGAVELAFDGFSRAGLEGGERPVLCGIRPEAFEERVGDDVTRATVRAKVELREELGAELFVYAEVEGPPAPLGGLAADDRGDEEEEPSEQVTARKLSIARLPSRSTVREGEVVELTIDPSGVHLFDAGTRSRLG